MEILLFIITLLVLFIAIILFYINENMKKYIRKILKSRKCEKESGEDSDTTPTPTTPTPTTADVKQLIQNETNIKQILTDTRTSYKTISEILGL